jgi:hypothetical protein
MSEDGTSAKSIDDKMFDEIAADIPNPWLVASWIDIVLPHADDSHE